MDEASKQQWSLNEIWNKMDTYNQNQKLAISWRHNEEAGFGEFDTGHIEG